MIRKTFVMITLLLTSAALMAQTAENCYQLYDKDKKLIWAKREPPFDISSPPLSAEYQASNSRGERLLITQTAKCGSQEEFENEYEIYMNVARAIVYGREAEKRKKFQKYLKECKEMGVPCIIPNEEW